MNWIRSYRTHTPASQRNNKIEKKTLRLILTVILLSWSLALFVIYLASEVHPIQSLPSGDIKASIEIKQ